MDIFLNSQLLPSDQARISVEDAGLQHAVGLFETMSVHHGRVFRLHQHLQRLLDSAAALGLTRKSALDMAQLRQAVQTTLVHNQLEQARLRLTVTAGEISLLRPAAPDAPPPGPTILVTVAPPVVYDPAYFERGIMAVIGTPGANPFDPLAGHKTLAYWGRLLTLRQAAAVGAGEAVWLNVTNHLASGAVSNIFLVKNGRLLTPIARGEEVAGALPAPVLPGITRTAVVELAGAMNLPVEKRMLSVADLLDADEAFLTNSSWHILPLTKVEKKPLAAGQVGEITRSLRAALLALIEKETAADAGLG